MTTRNALLLFRHKSISKIRQCHEASRIIVAQEFQCENRLFNQRVYLMVYFMSNAIIYANFIKQIARKSPVVANVQFEIDMRIGDMAVKVMWMEILYFWIWLPKMELPPTKL